MVYIRTKRIKGETYLYLVRSVWDKVNQTSKQEIVKYLGNAETVNPNDIPVEYREDPKIIAFLSSNIGKNVIEKEDILKTTRKNFFKCLTNGDTEKALKIFDAYSRSSSPDEFYEMVLKPVMYKVGDLWEKNKLSVASEHIASNVAHDLVKVIGDQISKVDSRGKILICTPVGEEHNLGCNILESFLQSKRFKVFNLSPSAPVESVINYLKDVKPDIILVSITLEDNIRTGQRFVKKIAEKSNVPILVGGQAFENKMPKFDGKVIGKEPLKKIYEMIREEISEKASPRIIR